MTAAGGTSSPGSEGALLIQGLSAAQVGDVAFENAVRLHELAPLQASLEEAFMELTANSVQYHASTPADRRSNRQAGARTGR